MAKNLMIRHGMTRMYNIWNGRNTEGGCTVDGTAEIRREDV